VKMSTLLSSPIPDTITQGGNRLNNIESIPFSEASNYASCVSFPD
jgi:hypothetical protein